MELVILIVLLLLIFGAGPWWPHSRGWGYGPVGVILIILVVILVLRLA